MLLYNIKTAAFQAGMSRALIQILVPNHSARSGPLPEALRTKEGGLRQADDDKPTRTSRTRPRFLQSRTMERHTHELPNTALTLGYSSEFAGVHVLFCPSHLNWTMLQIQPCMHAAASNGLKGRHRSQTECRSSRSVLCCCSADMDYDCHGPCSLTDTYSNDSLYSFDNYTVAPVTPALDPVLTADR
jgi:hypothetical protein